MENFEKCTVSMLGGPCSQHVTGNTSRLNQPQSAIITYQAWIKVKLCQKITLLNYPTRLLILLTNTTLYVYIVVIRSFDATMMITLYINTYTYIFIWASCQIRKIAVCACAGNAGNVFPRRRLQRKSLVSDPGMHHGTCVTHVPWCMPGSLTRGGGEDFPGIPGACAPAILRIW